MSENPTRLRLILSLVTIFCSSLLVLYFGWQIGQTALTDPDTCFLVAVGRQILAGGLPQQDVFSWTAAGRPFVVYQWLSEIILASLLAGGGASSLAYLTGWAVAVAFLVLPLCLALRQGWPLYLVLPVASLGIAAGSFHFPCRPEIFSYLFLSTLVVSLFWPAKSCRPFLTACLSLLAFAVWANLHSGFVLGIFVLFLVALGSLVAIVWGGKEEARLRAEEAGVYWLALAGALLGSLVTPYGLALWAYLPHLFFSRVNRLNLELMPISIWELLSFDYLPYLALLGLALLGLIYLLRETLAKGNKPALSGPYLAFLLLAIISPLAGLGCRRMVPFTVLFFYGFFYVLAAVAGRRPGSQPSQSSWSLRSVYLLAVFVPLLLQAAGLAAALSFFPASLPQSTFGFALPQGALSYIERERPPGKLLNDPQFGDVMIFREGGAAQVFIDTRFDLYGDELVQNFWNMANARGNWRQLLESYGIDWIFLPPRAALVEQLKAARWRVLFSDDQAAILARPGAK